MHMKLVTLALGAALSAIASCVAADPRGAVVRVESGSLLGVRQHEIVVFRGIPFAAPPVGPLRWRPPQPVNPWRGVRRAVKYGSICEQIYNPKDNGVGAPPASEDCLTLNVFAPAAARATPVMVWIHGGGFVNGSGTAALYDGSALARQGVVVVTLNYRLGRFGFFAHPALTAESKGEAIGNYGLMDMIAALHWVKANIARFGGDPQQVTIFGESAGGIAVNELMSSSAARGLFVRAIVQSGLGREQAPSLSTAEQDGVAFAAKLGLQDATASELRSLTADQMLKAGAPDLLAGWGPMIDGAILSMRPQEAFASGLEAKVPYVVGFNSLEFPATEAELDKILGRMSSSEERAKLAAAYPDHASYAAHALSDLLFNEPALNFARLHASSGQPTWLYQFSVMSPAIRGALPGAPHASERQYVFKNLASSPWKTDANDTAQAELMSAYWCAFAKQGDPNGDGRTVWPRYSATSDELLDFTNDGPKVAEVPRRPAMSAIASLSR